MQHKSAELPQASSEEVLPHKTQMQPNTPKPPEDLPWRRPPSPRLLLCPGPGGARWLRPLGRRFQQAGGARGAPRSQPLTSGPGRGQGHPASGSSGCVVSERLHQTRSRPRGVRDCATAPAGPPRAAGLAGTGSRRANRDGQPRYNRRKPAVTHPRKEREAHGHAGGSDARLRPARAAPPAAGASPAAPSGAGAGAGPGPLGPPRLLRAPGPARGCPQRAAAAEAAPEGPD